MLEAGTRQLLNFRCMWPRGAWSWPNTVIGPTISRPGVPIGTRICDCWNCGEASGLVLTMTIMILQRGSPAPEM